MYNRGFFIFNIYYNKYVVPLLITKRIRRIYSE